MFISPILTATAIVLDFGFGSCTNRYGAMSDPAVFERVLAPIATVERAKPLELAARLDRAGADDLLVLPCGAAFPAAAGNAITNFFARGGSLFATGGYALDRPLALADGVWQDETALHLNKRHGLFRDCLKTEPTQVGLFDASFRLEEVASVSLSPIQEGILPEASLAGSVGGFAAVAVLGENGHGYSANHCAWRPILESFDRDGVARGPVGAFVRHYGSVYAGSQGAIFGVTDRDLFAAGTPFAERLLPAVVKRLLSRVSLAETTSGYACYREGEKAELKTRVCHYGKTPVTAAVRFVVTDEKGAVLHEEVVTVEAKPGAWTPVSAFWTVPSGTDDLLSYTAELRLGETLVDREDNALVVWHEATVGRGPKLAADGSLFTIDGRRFFAMGCQTHWGQWRPYTARSPKEMAADFAAMRACGFRWARLFLPWDAEFQKRISDAAVMLAQKYGLVIYHTQQWMDARAKGEELAKQNARIAEISERYRSVPGFAIDICNEPRLDETPASPEAVRQMKNWVDTNYAAARRARADVLLSVGHSQGWGGAKSTKDPAISVLDVPFTDRHYYGAWGSMFQDLKDMDLRALGKPLILAECGAKCHPSWWAQNVDGIGDTEERYDLRFKCYAAHSFGLGCSAMLAWMWRDPMEGQFPCGIVHQTRVPRRAARTLASMAKAFAAFELAENPPDVVVKMAEAPRMRDEGRREYLARVYAVDRALRYWGANWSKVTERALDRATGVRLVLDPDELPTADEAALRTAVGERLVLSDCARARETGDDEAAFFFRVPGAAGRTAHLVWNPKAEGETRLVRGGTALVVPAGGVGYVVTDAAGRALLDRTW